MVIFIFVETLKQLKMKKLFARFTLYSLLITIFCLFFWQILIKPNIEIYHDYGFIGVFIYVLCFIFGLFFVFIFLKFLDWLHENI